jgi:hypothetical protein
MEVELKTLESELASLKSKSKRPIVSLEVIADMFKTPVKSYWTYQCFICLNDKYLTQEEKEHYQKIVNTLLEIENVKMAEINIDAAEESKKDEAAAEAKTEPEPETGSEYSSIEEAINL